MSGSWKPRFSPDGTRITHEDGDVQQWENQWLDNDREIRHNGVHLVINGVVTEHPAGSVVAAGGGRWAAFVQTAPFTTYLSWAPPQIGCGNPAINQDGEYAYTDNFAGEVKTLWFRGKPIDTGAITDVRVSRQALVWSKAGRTWGYWLGGMAEVATEIQVAPQEYRPIPLDSPDGPWVLNHTPTGIIVRPFGEAMGHRFDNGGQCYYPDGHITGRVLLTIFTNSQGVKDAHSFDLNEPRVDLRVVDEQVPTLAWEGWFGFFDGGPNAPGTWKTDIEPQSLPGNCYLNVANGIVYTRDGQQVAQYVAAEQPGQSINDEVAKARLRHPTLPVVPYWTRQDHGGPVPDGDWIGIEAYQGKDEGDDAFVARLVAAAGRCRQVAFIPNSFTSNALLSHNLARVATNVARVINACTNVKAAFPFSGTGRPSGLWQHPEAVPAWEDFGFSITTPSIVLINPQQPQPQEPHVPDNRPTPEQWINHEFPQLIAAYRANPTNAQIMQEVPGAPFAEWGAFQGMRRFGPEGWSFEKMLADVAKEAP